MVDLSKLAGRRGIASPPDNHGAPPPNAAAAVLGG